MTKNLPVVQQKAKDLREYLGQGHIKKQLEMALPKWLSADRLLRVVFTATMKNPRLLDCTTESLLGAIMQCAQLGLEPILGRAYLIPYENSKEIGGEWTKVLEAQFQPGYQGLVDLAMRSGKVNDVYSMVVYENDHFEIEYGTNRRLVHRPTLKGDPGEPIGAYAVWELKDTPKPSFEFMPLHEIYKRRDKSQAYQFAIKNPKNKNAQDCPWIQWPEEQIRKTVVKHSAKMKPASIEMMQAIELDHAAEVGVSTLDFFSDTPLLVEGKKAAKPDAIEAFDKLVEDKGGGYPSFVPFLIETAKGNKLSVDELKTQSVEQFDELWTAFEKWRSKPEKNKSESPPAAPPRVLNVTEATTEATGPWDEQNWTNLRKPGFATHVHKNLATFPDAPAKIQAKVIDKWHKPNFYSDTPFPTIRPPNVPKEGDTESKAPIAPDQTIKPGGFPLTDEAVKALGSEGPEIYGKACDELNFKDGPFSDVTDKAISSRMSTIADRDYTEGAG